MERIITLKSGGGGGDGVNIRNNQKLTFKLTKHWPRSCGQKKTHRINMRIDYAAKDSCPLKTPPFSNTNSSCWPDRRGHSSSWTADVATKKSPSACDIMVKLLTENIKKYETRKFSAIKLCTPKENNWKYFVW